MPVQPLKPDMSNKAAYVNSLFDGDVRAADGLAAAIRDGALTYAFSDATSQGLILSAWLAGWQQAVGGDPDPAALARCPAQDLAWLSFFAKYIQTNGLSLCMPQLTLDHLDDKGRAVYRNAGYERQPFLVGTAWQYGSFDAEGRLVGNPDQATVGRFLELVFHGAHMVAIQSDKDGGAGVTDLRDTMEDALPTRVDPVSSHYGGAAVGTGRYYTPDGAPVPSILHPDVESLATSAPPGKEPLLFAILVGVTAVTHRNEFLQLEGWPAQTWLTPPGGARHNADFDQNEATLWNFATFGCCAYSEKRSTPVFLARDSFDLTLRRDTGMPWYWGANAGNVGDSWMHPELVVFGEEAS